MELLADHSLQARVTLARALYSQAEILLLDDILAALDVHTAKWIVDNALSGDLVRNRTVILVSHNVALCAPVANWVVALSRNGRIANQGTMAEVLKRDAKLRAAVEKDEEEITKAEQVVDKDKDTAADGEEAQKKTAGKLIVAEEKAMGRVGKDAFMLYINGLGGWFAFLVITVLRFLESFVGIGETWFIGYWAAQYELMPVSAVPVLK